MTDAEYVEELFRLKRRIETLEALLWRRDAELAKLYRGEKDAPQTGAK